jgi:hypothetical protein
MEESAVAMQKQVDVSPQERLAGVSILWPLSPESEKATACVISSSLTLHGPNRDWPAKGAEMMPSARRYGVG